jgi:PEP-CTERM motif
MKITAALATLLSLALVSVAQAKTVSYGIDFNVEYTFAFAPLDPRVAVGNTYTGSFTVDSAMLSQDGINRAGDVAAFSVAMENVAWTLDQGKPWSAAFRGPNGMGFTSPGFDVTAGRITNLRGGVFGGADYPFIDFSTDQRSPPSVPSQPACTGAYCGNHANAFYTLSSLGAFGGSMNVHALASPVPEPEAWRLLLAGIVLVALARRRA